MPVLWPHIPTEIQETLEFFTDVRKSREGEFRDSVKVATQVLAYSYMLEDYEAERMRGLFGSQPLGEWYVPIFHDATRITTNLASGTTSISIEDDADYIVGGRAAIIENDLVAEIVTVSDASGGTLTCSALANDYLGSPGDPLIVCPIRTCLSPTGITEEIKYNISKLQIQFFSIEPTDLELNPYSTLGSFSVLSDDRLIVDGATGGLSQALDFIESGFGAFSLESEESYSRRRAVVSFIDVHYPERYARRRWLHYVRGQDLPFYLPTWKRDYELLASAVSGSAVIRVRPTVIVASTLVGKAVALTVGAISIFRTIDSVADGGTYFDLTLNTTHGIDIPTTAMVSVATLMRFETDSFQINHKITPDGFVSRFQAPAVEVVA